MNNKSSMLRKMAMQAKMRLNGASAEKEINRKKELTTMAIYKNLYRNNFKIISYIDDNKEFYQKVKYLLSVSPDSPCILKELVAQDEYSKLDESQKIGYMLDLAERYHRVKKQIEAERKDEQCYQEMSF